MNREAAIQRLASPLRYAASQHNPPYPLDTDDLYQEAMLAVVKLWDKRDPAMGEGGWYTYAKRRGEGAMLDLMRQVRWGRRWHHDPSAAPISLDVQVTGAEPGVTILDTVEVVEDFSELEVAEAVASLPERERIIVEMVLADRSRREIGDRFGVHESRISQILRDHVKPALAEALNGAQAAA